jgi:glucose-6-phosphate-specific signal transduction histidine kinase
MEVFKMKGKIRYEKSLLNDKNFYQIKKASKRLLNKYENLEPSRLNDFNLDFIIHYRISNNVYVSKEVVGHIQIRMIYTMINNGKEFTLYIHEVKFKNNKREVRYYDRFLENNKYHDEYTFNRKDYVSI